MEDIVADLHLHSKYSRAVSPQMVPSVMDQFGRAKGLELLATGDWTHPLWYRELKSQLEESEEGIYKLKSQVVNTASPTNPNQQTTHMQKETRFLLSVEIACIYSQGGKGRRIHNLVFVPSFATAEKVNKALLTRGFNLSSDGRPILGLSSKNLLQLLLEIDETILLIPAHVWTPWFGIYGQMSGFMSLEEAFEDLAPFVYGIETGLSSDPIMNWQMQELQTRSILSFSDAHSAAKMGREATVFRLKNVSYENIRAAIMAPSLRSVTSNKERDLSALPHDDKDNKVLYTIEFYPEEGKYHYSGHRNCNVTMTPDQQRATKGICPVCKRPVTDGVMRRVQELAGLHQDSTAASKKSPTGLQWITDPTGIHPPFVRLVPLLEIIAEAMHAPVGSPKGKVIFDSLCHELGCELDILLKLPIQAIEKAATQVTTTENAKRVAEGVKKVREAIIVIRPGYDGVYGVVKIWPSDVPLSGTMEGQEQDKDIKEAKTQIGLEF